MLQIEMPWVLALLPLPILVMLLSWRSRRTAGSALKVPFLQQLQTFAAGSRWFANRPVAQWLLMSVVWSLLVVAASNPVWLGKPIEIERSGRDIFIALDLSGSMKIPDMSLAGREMSRLDVVKAVGRRFIQQRHGDRLGLILFGEQAYLQTPLTFDRDTVLYMLEDATVGLAGRMTAIGDAIGLDRSQQLLLLVSWCQIIHSTTRHLLAFD